MVSLNVFCDYRGAFNADPSCDSDLEVVLAGGGSTLVGVGVVTQTDIITFFAQKESSTLATLQWWVIGNDTTLHAVTGTVQLLDGGRSLVIAPDSSPFDLQDVQLCPFDRYTGTYTGVLSGPGVGPARRVAGTQLASR